MTVQVTEVNSDGSAYGDICRKVKTLNPDQASGRLTVRESLIKWLVDNGLALVNESLRESQLNPVVPSGSSSVTRDVEAKERTEPLSDPDRCSTVAAEAGSSKHLQSRNKTSQQKTEKQVTVDPKFGTDKAWNECSSVSSSCEDGENVTVYTKDGAVSQGPVSATGPNIPGSLLFRGKSYRQPYGSIKDLQLPDPIVAVRFLKVL